MRTVSSARVRDDVKTPTRTALERDVSAANTSMQPISAEANMISRLQIRTRDVLFHLIKPCLAALMGSGEQAQQLPSNLAVRGVRIYRLNRLPQRLESGVGSLALTALLHVGPLSVDNGPHIGVQTVQDRRSGWGR